MKLVLKQAVNDSARIKTCNHLSEDLSRRGDMDEAIGYAQEGLKLSRKSGNAGGVCWSANNLGNIYIGMGDYPQGTSYFKLSLHIGDSMGNKKLTALAYGNLGNVYSMQANYTLALDYFLKALALSEKIKNREFIVVQQVNIANVYSAIKNFEKAIQYQSAALKSAREIHDEHLEEATLANIGSTYEELPQPDLNKALDYYGQAHALAEKLGEKSDLATIIGETGFIYFRQSKTDLKNAAPLRAKALENYKHALALAEEVNDQSKIAMMHGNIGVLLAGEKKYAEAEPLLQQAWKLAKDINDMDNQCDWEEALSDLYAKTGKAQLAFEFYQKFISTRDSIRNDENLKQQTQLEMNYEFDKKEAVAKAEYKKELEHQQAVSQSEKKRQNLFIALVAAIAGAAIVISLAVFRSLKITNEQKKIIEKQTAIVEERQKDIIDSIQYAKKIQTALITSENYITRKLNELNR